jgi:hypothetical protein
MCDSIATCAPGEPLDPSPAFIAHWERPAEGPHLVRLCTPRPATRRRDGSLRKRGGQMSDRSMSQPNLQALFSEEVVRALRSALRRRIAEEPQDGDLRAALQRVSGETRAQGLHGEHVVLLVKQLWGELAEATQHLAPDERRVMLERLVTRCLDEYYSGE